METLLPRNSSSQSFASFAHQRRKSTVFQDAVHDFPINDYDLAPAQLYSTESGRLFHSGRICIVLVGLPARGKTHTSVAVGRYLKWLGVKTHIFHLGDYRRTLYKDYLPDDYFWMDACADTVKMRSHIAGKCREDIYWFFEEDHGQVAIYDAVNMMAEGRRALAKELGKHEIRTFFIESVVSDEKILLENVRSVKIGHPDFTSLDADAAVHAYLERLQNRIPHYETMDEPELHWVKMINAGQRIEINNGSFGYLSQRIVYYLLNLHIKSRQTYFVRSGTTKDEDSYKADASLSSEGVEYAQRMTETLLRHRAAEHAAYMEDGGIESPERPLEVWTSTRRRTIETAQFLEDAGLRVRQRAQMSQMNPGVCEKMSEARIRREMPDEVEKHIADPYHHRYPRAESYHDLAVRLEPIILELERSQTDLLLIAHESVLRVLYGYLMASGSRDIPTLEFPRDEIIEIIPASYHNIHKRIHISGVPQHIRPGSPEDIALPVPPSGAVSPFSGIGTPQLSGSTSPAKGSPRIDGVVQPQRSDPFDMSKMTDASLG